MISHEILFETAPGFTLTPMIDTVKNDFDADPLNVDQR